MNFFNSNSQSLNAPLDLSLQEDSNSLFSFTNPNNESLFSSPNKEAEEPQFKKIPLQRFNEIDVKLFEDASKTQTIKNEYLKLELKIESTEKELKRVREQLNISRIVNHKSDSERIKYLEDKEKNLIFMLDEYKLEYDKLGTSPILANKVSEFIDNALMSVETKIKRGKSLFDVLTIIPNLNEKQKIKEDVKDLMTIQKRLNELSRIKNSPYGEKEININDYIAFMTKANELNCQLTKKLNNEINFQKRSRLFILHYYKKLLKFIKSNVA